MFFLTELNIQFRFLSQNSIHPIPDALLTGAVCFAPRSRNFCGAVVVLVATKLRDLTPSVVAAAKTRFHVGATFGLFPRSTWTIVKAVFFGVRVCGVERWVFFLRRQTAKPVFFWECLRASDKKTSPR